MEYWNLITTNKEIIFGFIGLVGTIFTIYGLCIKHGYKLGYTTQKSLPLYAESDVEKDLQILYKGKRISLLRGKTFRIFNYGDKELRKEDLYSNKLSIIVTDGKILNMDFKVKDKEGNARIIKVNDSKCNIEFDYMNPLQIYEVSILYDGNDATIDCHAAGMPKMQLFYDEFSLKNVIQIAAAICIFSIISLVIYFSNFPEVSYYFIFAFCIFGLIILTYALVIQTKGWIKSPNPSVFKYNFSNKEKNDEE